MIPIVRVVLMAVLSSLVFATAHAAEKHLFYFNGCCVDGPDDNKASAYQEIAGNLRDSGYNVHFDIRYDDSAERLLQEVDNVTRQVNALLANGTAAKDITVSGYSLGSVITLYASIAIANPKVNYVLLAGCPGPNARHFDIDYSKVQGHVLSVIDTNDDRFGSCAGKLPDGLDYKEVTLDSGKGHKLFRIAKDPLIRQWKEPLLDWVK